MSAFFALLCMCLVSATAIACGINFFLRIGPWRSLGYALFAVSVFLIFCASGLWADASRHAWGVLAPVFALMLLGGWTSLKFGARTWTWLREKRKGANGEKHD